MVALAGLESGVITPDTLVSCPGHFALGNTVWHCWRKGGHGTLNLRGAIKNSCDVFFYETARRLGIDRIAAMAKRFGSAAGSISRSQARRRETSRRRSGISASTAFPGSSARRSAPVSGKQVRG